MSQKKRFKKGIVDAAKLAKKTIDLNPLINVKTETLARNAHVSRNILQEAFKDKFGTSIGQYKLDKRMTHAKALLKNGKSIKELSIIMQYASPSSFSNAFRNYNKVSPTEWLQRENNTNGNKQNKI